MTLHWKTQAWRFARLFALAYVAAAASGNAWTLKTLLSLVPPSLEVAWRQFAPATPDNAGGG